MCHTLKASYGSYKCCHGQKQTSSSKSFEAWFEEKSFMERKSSLYEKTQARLLGYFREFAAPSYDISIVSKKAF